MNYGKIEKKRNLTSSQQLPNERIGKGIAKGHLGEYLQGYFDDIQGNAIDRACISVPLKIFIPNHGVVDKTQQQLSDIPRGETGSIAFFFPSKTKSLTVEPKNKVNSKKAALATLKLLKKSSYGGTLKIVTAGGISQGFGTSTSDIVASIRAISDSFHCQISNHDIAKISVDCEKASDGIMYSQATLFVTTQGRVLEDFHVPYPAVNVIGFNVDRSGKGLNTLDIPPRSYTREEKKQFMVLRGAIKKALIEQDIDLLGKVAIASARINQRFIEKPSFDDLIQLTEKYEVAGFIVAHSGTRVGIIIDPRRQPSASKMHRLIDDIESLDFFDIKQYQSE